MPLNLDSGPGEGGSQFYDKLRFNAQGGVWFQKREDDEVRFNDGFVAVFDMETLQTAGRVSTAPSLTLFLTHRWTRRAKNLRARLKKTSGSAASKCWHTATRHLVALSNLCTRPARSRLPFKNCTQSTKARQATANCL